MLENIDLSRKVSKEEYKSVKEVLEPKLAELQRCIKKMEIPLIIVFEGWDAAGKGGLINELILPLDPRNFRVYSTQPPNQEEMMRPFLCRFWRNTPERGRITIYDHSWYRMALDGRVSASVTTEELLNTFNDIRSFERQLADDGNIIVKFFLHISHHEQKKRFDELRKNQATSWRVSKDDLKRQKQYKKYMTVTEEMLAETDSEFAPWSVIEAHDWRFATLKIFNTVISAMEHHINLKKSKVYSVNKNHLSDSSFELPININMSILDKIDLSLECKSEDYPPKLEKKQKQLRELSHELYMRKIPLVVVYQGWDAAGKGGNIKRLTQNLDPRGYEVIPISAPNVIEKAHHYLRRFWIRIPRAGHIIIFDRSWYGRVLDERVEGFCSEEEWKRAYREINEMEKHLTDFGTILLKFWLHIDKDEQLKRFEARQNDQNKQWKITEEDWRNRKKWDMYKIAVEEMLFRTSTSHAPWTIVESNNKPYARLKVLQTVINAIEKRI
ncbi:MAG: polyphosphate:AMP phosphotransferase [Desulfamplus sp.]|nr:polyphosphate:AMP phosphotransferase [Desulfamplus sp.]